MVSAKQRMLNAYQGIPSDRWPVAPEFWSYYPAKVLGVDMIEFEREVPHWKALQATFRKFDSDGWGIASPNVANPDVNSSSRFEWVSEQRYREITVHKYRGEVLESSRIFDKNEPSWGEKHAAETPGQLLAGVEMALSDRNNVDFREAAAVHAAVGGDFLLELYIGCPFFDFIAGLTGFEQAVLLFANDGEGQLETLQQHYIENRRELVRRGCLETPFESMFIGCAYSCNSLIGPTLWREWDKPFIRQMTEEAHRYNKHIHVHFHGKSMQTATDFAEAEIDCVCPFERPPGGDVDGLAGLRSIRDTLMDRVTMNGNVHTVETLIRGGPEDVRREVRQIKEAFQGSARVIIGTGDQVGRETPEENILAMIEEGRQP